LFDRTKRRFSRAFSVLGVCFLFLLISSVSAKFNYVDKEWDFDEKYEKEYKRGRFIEFSDDEFCHSWILFPGYSLYPWYYLAFVYGMVLIYLFLGVAIISDIFMEAIEVITAHTVKKKYIDKEGQERVAEVAIWNPTIANLSLMALGSSAPEILLSVTETILTLGDKPGELGPSTIVGSAAFNLLVISAVSIMSVPAPELKKIDDLGVFAITAISSLWAYIWMFICLKIWTPDEITIWEAIITFSFFVVLLSASYAADKLRAWKLKK